MCMGVAAAVGEAERAESAAAAGTATRESKALPEVDECLLATRTLQRENVLYNMRSGILQLSFR